MSFQIQQIVTDPFNTNKNAVAAYILAYDGSLSAVWHSPNVASGTPVWTKGATMNGPYSVLRIGNAPGEILMYGTGKDPSAIDPCATGCDWQIDFDFAGGSLGWGGIGPFGGCATTYDSSLGGWRDSGIPGACNCPFCTGAQYAFVSQADVRFVIAYVNNSATGQDNNLFFIGTNYANQSPFGGGTTQGDTAFGHIGVSSLCQANDQLRAGVPTGPLDNGLWPLDAINVSWNTRFYSPVMNKVSIAGKGTAPLPSFYKANVAYSTDYGVTVPTPIVVGDRPGAVGGMDAQKNGTVSYAAASDVVYKASSIGGAYSAFVNTTGTHAVCIIQPWFKRNSTTLKNTSGSSPDCIMALGAVDTDGGCLYWVDGDGTKHNITPPGVTEFDNANCVTTLRGDRIACFGKVSGTYYIFESLDGGATWTRRSSLTSPHYIRSRRNDTRKSPKGQLLLAVDGFVDYGSTWGNPALYQRTMPTSGIDGFDVVP